MRSLESSHRGFYGDTRALALRERRTAAERRFSTRSVADISICTSFVVVLAVAATGQIAVHALVRGPESAQRLAPFAPGGRSRHTPPAAPPARPHDSSPRLRS